MSRGSHDSRVLQLVTKATKAFRANDWTLRQIDPDGLKYVATTSVKGHWFILPVLLLAYRRLQKPLEEAPRKPARTMGGDRWNNCIPDGGPGFPMHGGPRDGGLRRETWLPLAPDRGRWATS